MADTRPLLCAIRSGCPPHVAIQEERPLTENSQTINYLTKLESKNPSYNEFYPQAKKWADQALKKEATGDEQHVYHVSPNMLTIPHKPTGIEENRLRYKFDQAGMLGEVVPPVVNGSPVGHWLVMESVRMEGVGSTMEQKLLHPSDLVDVLNHDLPMTESTLSDNLVQQKKETIEDRGLYDTVLKLIETVDQYSQEGSLSVGEFVAPRNWGLFNGRLVNIDFGIV